MAVKITFKNLLWLSAFMAMGSLASASPVNINCAGPGGSQVTVPDVTALSPDTCSVVGSNLIFSDFGVNSTDPTTPIIGIESPSQGTGFTGGDTNLAFSDSGGNVLDDSFVTYQATGQVLGLDMSFQATPLTGNGFVSITEVACSSPFVGNTCPGTTYADFGATSICVGGNCTLASNAAFLTGGTESAVYVQNDIALNGAAVNGFNNSFFSTAAVPEPALAAPVLGVSILGLGLLSRRRRRNHIERPR
jgi:hypothetical protein